MIRISLCMIVKNEEACLRECLASVKDIVDEYIIVDTGSTDQTKSIIKEFTDTVYAFEWINDFSAARNFAFSLATKEYVLWLDADDVISPENQALFLTLKANLSTSIDVVTIIYDITFNTNGDCILSLPRDRLLKNKQGFYWRYFVHEELVVSGTYFHSDIHITHTSDHGNYSRYTKNYEKRLADGFELLPREKYFYGGELYMSGDYERCIVILKDFINTPILGNYEMQHAYLYLSFSYQKLGKLEEALPFLFSSFAYQSPDLSSYYSLGLLLYQLGRYEDVIYWLLIALKADEPKNASIPIDTKAFVYNLISLSYYYNNQINQAKIYNDLTLLLDPVNEIAIYNDEFFKRLPH